MVLFTFNKKYESFAITRLERQNIDYIIQPVGNDRLNLFFGKRECLDAIRMIVTKPLCQLSPEEDFILGAMLGYDICAQCERYCERKKKACWLFRPICLVLGHMVICWWKTPSMEKKWQYCQKILVKREFKEPFGFLVLSDSRTLLPHFMVTRFVSFLFSFENSLLKICLSSKECLFLHMK